MALLFVVIFLGVTFGISFWNAYASGAYWTESKIIGGWIRFITWCGLIMSACGFTWVYTMIITMFLVASGKLTPDQAKVMLQLAYVALILPILGSGFGLWARSLAVAYRQRTFGSIGVGSWNSFAQVHNTWEAAREAPGALRQVIKAFSSKDKSRDNGLAIVILILAVAGGILTTMAIARWADRRVALNVGNGDIRLRGFPA